VPGRGAMSPILPTRRSRRPLRVAVSPDLTEIPVAWRELERLLVSPFAQIVLAEIEDDQVVVREDVDAIVAFAPRVTERTLTPSVRLVARLGVGYENVDLAACNARGVAVTITPDAVRRPVASAAVAMLLAIAHNLVVKDELVRAGRWAERHAYIGNDISGKTAGFVGFGNLGREIARLLAPWNMNVIACRGDATDKSADRDQVGSLEDVLQAADALFIVCPLNDSTRNLIGQRELEMMKPSAVLINIARGAIVQEDALIRALQNGTIRAAGLDVFAEEPLSPGHPLTQLANVLLAPHSLGHLDSLFENAVANIVEELETLRRGGAHLHLVRQTVAPDHAGEPKAS